MILTNSEMLKEKIKSKGLKLNFLASKLGLSRQGFKNKVDNINEFTASEIIVLCDVLTITNLKEKEAIFFAKEVD